MYSNQDFKKYLTVEVIFPALIALISLNALSVNLSQASVNLFAIIVSLIGLGAALLFFKENKFYRQLIFIWLFAQLIIIEKTIIDPSSGVHMVEPILNLSQGFALRFGIKLMGTNTIHSLDINFSVIIVWLLLETIERKFLAKKLINKTVEFAAFRQGTSFSDLFPLQGVIKEVLTVDKEVNWLLVDLKTTITYEDITFSQVIIKSKDQPDLDLKKGNQFIYFRLVPINTVFQAKNSINDFPFVDWVIVQHKP